MNSEPILDVALGITDPAERQAMLDEICAGFAGVRARVDALLATVDPNREQRFREVIESEVTENRIDRAIREAAMKLAPGDEHAIYDHYVRLRLEQMEWGYRRRLLDIAKAEDSKNNRGFEYRMKAVLVLIAIAAIVTFCVIMTINDKW